MTILQSIPPPPAQRPPPLRGARLLMVAHSCSIHTHRWARYFREQGMTVLVVSPMADPIRDIDVIQFPPRQAWYHRLKGLHLYVDYPRWRAIFRRFRPDIVHVHYPDGGGRNHFYFEGIRRLITSTWGSDVVETPDFPLSDKHKAGVSAVLRRSHAVTATTRFLARVTARYCPPGAPIHVIPFGVDCNRFRPDPARLDPSARLARGHEIRIGFTKNLERKYGPEVLVQAFPQIARHCPNARLIMCGRGPMAEQLRDTVASLGLSSRVDFPGRLPHDQIIPLVQSLDLLVMPSTCQESFGVAAIEASACEVPVVATNVGGVPEAVLDGQTGLLVPPYDPDAIANACIQLILDPDRRLQMGRAGRALVLRNYQWHANATTMAHLYTQLISSC